MTDYLDTTTVTDPGPKKKMTIRELLDQKGKIRNVYCGCIGWVSGHPRSTRGKVASFGRWYYFHCDNCGRYWRRRDS